MIILLTSTICWAADVHKSVKESGGDYATMNDCVDGEIRDLSTGNVYCEASGTWASADTTSISIPSGYTNPDSTHRLYITALNDGARHNGTPNSVSGANNYRNSATGFSQYGLSTAALKYVVVEYIEFISNGSGNGIGIAPPSWPDDQGWIVQKNIIHGFTGGYGIQLANSGNTSYYLNNIIYDCYQGIRSSDNTNVFVENNTLYSNDDYGLEILNGGGSGAVYKNNLSLGNTTADYDSFADSTHNNNAASDTTGDIDNYVDTSQFTNAGSRNLLLKTGADSIDAGADLSATFTDDINGTTRPQNSVYDLGADEFESGGGGGGSRRIILIQ